MAKKAHHVSKKSLKLDGAIGEWLRDSDEIGELLIAMGEEVPLRDERREHLIKLFEASLPEEVAAFMYEHARQFALMLDDIVSFCSELGLAIAGQIQLPAGLSLSRESILDTSWAHIGRIDKTVDISARAAVLAAELTNLAETVDTRTLIQPHRANPSESTVSIINKYGLRDFNEATRHPWAADEIRRVYTQQRRQPVCAANDLRALERALDAVKELDSTLAGLPKLPGASVALDELQLKLESVLGQMNNARVVEHKEAHLGNSLGGAVALVGAQMRNLAGQASDAKRAMQGLHAFRRSEFWPSRWRIFELWILVRVLRTIQRAGGTISPIGVEGTVWTMLYGRASRPVAECDFAGRTLLVFYQLYVEADRDSMNPNTRTAPNDSGQLEKSAGMPDIALCEAPNPATVLDPVLSSTHAKHIAVIDPKHGPSYSFASVEEVLIRYAKQFPSSLTAVVNYTPISAYQFQELRTDTGRQHLLASRVQPGTSALRRLELRLEEILVAHFGTGEQISNAPTERVRVRPNRLGAWLYWADKANQIDEPSGAWIVQDGSAPEHLSGLTALMNGGELTGLYGAENGQAVALVGKSTTTGKRFLRILSVNASALTDTEVKTAVWDHSGQRLLVVEDRCVRVYDRSCKILSEWPRDAYSTFWWSADDKFVLCFVVNWKPLDFDDERYVERYVNSGNARALLLVGVPNNDSDWDEHFSVDLGPSSPSTRNEPHVGREPGGTSFLVKNTGYGDFRVNLESQESLQRCKDAALPLSVAPGATRSLQTQPNGLYGVTLLRFVDHVERPRDWPLLRFHGRDLKVVAWDSNATRIAFKVAGRLLAANIGDRYATPISLPHQAPAAVTWVDGAILRRFRASRG